MDLQAALHQRARVEEFQRRHRIGLLTLLFTDLVGSTKLKQELGDQDAVILIQRHHALVREILGRFKEGEEIGTAGDSFFIVFTKPSDAVQFSLRLQNQLRTLAGQISPPLRDRVGIHIGEVVVEERPDSAKPKDLYGLQVDICARVMSLADGDQVLLTRSAFDNARQVLKGQEIEGINQLSWLNHGPYSLKGVEEPLEICEVGEVGGAVLKPPPDSEKVHRYVSPGSEPVLGWRPAIGQMVPNTQWVLEEKLGEGGFGEVWLGRHSASKERRVFKFCFRADRVRSLKRELTLFKLLKERFGQHPNIVAVYDVYFDQPPFYLEVEYVPGRDLRRWSEERGGLSAIPLEERLEIVAQVADALQAAHEAGVIHRDVKPGNILIRRSSRGHEAHFSKSKIRNPKSEIKSAPPDAGCCGVDVKLTDFGIGQVVSEEILAGVTGAGFTETLLSTRSSSGAGTYLYLAPELVAGQRASIRSDIYSLGVVLYQLVVGDLSRPVATDWQEKIADPLLLEDLKQCLAGEPGRRLSEAGQLAENLRSLEKRRAALAKRERVELAASERAAARPRIFRMVSWAAGAVVVLALLISLVAITWQAMRTIRVEREAQAEASRSRQTASFLDDMVRSVQAAVALGADPAKLHGILDTAAERVSKEFQNHPRGEAEIRTAIGSAYRELGDYAKAEANYQTALALTTKHLGNDHPNVATLQSTLASLLQAQAKLPSDEARQRAALAMSKKTTGEQQPQAATLGLGPKEVPTPQGKDEAVLPPRSEVDKLPLTSGTTNIKAEDPRLREIVITAAKKLADEGNYSWTLTRQAAPRMSSGPSASSESAEPSVRGKTDKGGFTHVAFTQAIGRRRVACEVVIKDNKVAFKEEEIWWSLDELITQEGRDGVLALAAYRFLDFKSPAAIATELAARARGLNESDGAIYWDLTEEDIKTSFGAGILEGASKGFVKFWVNNGVLTKYEYTTTVLLRSSMRASSSGSEGEINQTPSVEIKDVGTTKVEVPEEAKAKLRELGAAASPNNRATEVPPTRGSLGAGAVYQEPKGVSQFPPGRPMPTSVVGPTTAGVADEGIRAPALTHLTDPSKTEPNPTMNQRAAVEIADPTDIWSWTTPGRQGGEPRKSTLKLKLEGEKVTGTLTTPGRGGQTTAVAIEEGGIRGDEISFSVTRTFQDNKFTTKYVGKISGDTIKGTMEAPGRGGGEPQKREWVAKREVAN
ncbi:MAG: protein kinase [Verrucomicrobia bacterium]|nr:protein kinase [Verrucomicrobiota bacterium]